MDKQRKCVALFGFCLILVNVPLVCSIGRPSTIVFENNQFKNVVIAIHDSVAEDRTLINTLKFTMRKASEYLYKATRERAYFREVTILLPASWTNDAAYGVPTKESLRLADVIITDPTRSRRSLPQTRSYTGCGKQGVHVLLTKEFLTDQSLDPYMNNSAKYFIHAFAQFRWGVYQEYAEDGENPFYFSPSEGRADAIKCTLGIHGLIASFNTNPMSICYPTNSIDPNTNLYFPYCHWKPYPVRQRVRASIMDHQYISEIETFCDDNVKDSGTRHNYEAPSKHNRLCGHRSTWDVITSSTDFENDKNPNITIGPSQLTPTFKILRARSRRRRAVVAVETPLLANGPGIQVAEQIRRFCHDHTDENLEIGVVHYSDRSHQLLPFGKLEPSTELPSLSVADVQLEDVNITDGIMRSVQSLQDNGQSPEGSSVILLVKTRSQFTSSVLDMIDELRRIGIDIHIISLDDENDDWPVESLHGSHHPGTTVYDHLSSIFNDMSTEHQQYVTKVQEDIYVTSEMPYEGNFYLFPELCFETIVSFQITRDSFHVTRESEPTGVFDLLPRISLKAPHSDADIKSEDCERDHCLVRYHFHNQQCGPWQYSVNTSLSLYKLTITVKAKPPPPQKDENPITLRHQIRTNVEDHNVALYCDVTRGNHPVIGLDVTALLAKHGGSFQKIQLWDNGAGADIFKNDGVYSRYVTKLDKGIYHVTYKVLGEDGKVWSKEETLEMTSLHGPELATRRKMSKRSVDGAVQRHLYGGSFRLQKDLHVVEVDVIPPSRVADLEVVQILPYRNSLILSWIAPGDDLDSGKVSSYELFVGRDIKDVREILAFAETSAPNSNIEKEIVSASKPAGEMETFLWNMGDISKVKSFAFAIRALDEAGNKAAISNVATTGFPNK